MEEKNENVHIVHENNGKVDDSAAQDAIIALNIKGLRNLRVRADGLIHIVKNTGGESFERIQAVSHLTLLRGWFQDVLEYLGEDAINKSNTLHTFNDIQDDTDKSDGIKVQVKKVTKGVETVTDANDIESLNHVRRDLGYIENQVNQLVSIMETAYETFIFQHLRECKIWLDQEMFRLKQVAKQKIFSQTQQGKRILPQRPPKEKPIFSNLQGSRGIPRGKSASIMNEPKVVVETKKEDDAKGETNS